MTQDDEGRERLGRADAKLRKARQLHFAGKLAEAELAYLEVLRLEPGHAAAMSMMGALYLQRGEPARAVEVTQRALGQDPTSAITSHRLAVAYSDLRDWEKVIQQCDVTLRLDPSWSAAHFRRGVALHARRQLSAALRSFETATRLKPDSAEAHVSLAIVLRELGNPAAALESFDRALTIEPNSATALSSRSNALFDLKRFDDALASAEAALAVNGHSAVAHNNRGNALLALGRTEEALQSFDAAIEERADYATALFNRGAALLVLERTTEAVESFDKALAMNPSLHDAHNGRGVALLDLQRFAEALESFRTAAVGNPADPRYQANYRHALRRAGHIHTALAAAESAVAEVPDSAEARFSRGLALLTLGRFAEGWEDYEYRWDTSAFDTLRDKLPPRVRERIARELSIEDLAGRRVLLLGEQGVGDIVMFASMIPDLQSLTSSVSLACDPRLHRLFSNSFENLTLVAPGTLALQAEQADIVLGLGSLGRLFRRTFDAFSGSPYLRPTPEALDRWETWLGPQSQRRRIGISWRGGIQATGRASRSMSLAQLAPLFALPDCEFISLQYGDHTQELTQVSETLTRPVRVPKPDEIDDFDDLAALTSRLDAVVTVQTALVHVSGAVGAPCFVMVPHAPEWRYMWSGDTMPWYSSVRLFRQGEDRAWEPVIGEISRVLSLLAATALTGDA